MGARETGRVPRGVLTVDDPTGCWLPAENVGRAATELAVRPAGRSLDVEMVTDLGSMLLSVPPGGHVVVDIRSVEKLDSAAIDALVLLRDRMREDRDLALEARITGARQLLALEAMWTNLLIG